MNSCTWTHVPSRGMLGWQTVCFWSPLKQAMESRLSLSPWLSPLLSITVMQTRAKVKELPERWAAPPLSPKGALSLALSTLWGPSQPLGSTCRQDQGLAFFSLLWHSSRPISGAWNILAQQDQGCLRRQSSSQWQFSTLAHLGSPRESLQNGQFTRGMVDVFVI